MKLDGAYDDDGNMVLEVHSPVQMTGSVVESNSRKMSALSATEG